MQINFEKYEVNEEAREITFSCASNIPCSRYDEEHEIEYNQILIVNENSVDLSRLNNGAPLLFNHDTDKLLGMVIDSYIVQDKVFVRVAFSKNDEFADRIFKDILDGIIKNVSIGYQIENYDDKQENGINNRYVTKWMIYEVSIVSIPADNYVGIRNFNITKQETKSMKKQIEKQEIQQTEIQKVEQTKKPAEQIETIAEQTEIKACGEDDKLARLQAENEQLKRKLKQIEKEQNVDEKEQIYTDKEQIEKIGQDFEIEKQEIERAIAQKLTVKEFKNKIKNLNFNIKKEEQNTMNNTKRDFENYLQARNFEKPFTLRDFTGFGGKTSENGSALIGTDTIQFIPALEKVMGVKGYRTLSNLHYNIAIPVQSGRNTVYQTADLRTAATESNPQFTQKTLTPVKLSGNTVIGTQLIVQSNTDIVGFIIDSLTKEIAYKLEDFILGKVVSANPTEINYSALSAITWDDILAFQAAVGAYALNDLQFVGSPSCLAQLKSIPKTSNYPQFLCSADNKVNGYTFNKSGCVSNNNLYFGDFSKMVVGFFGQGLDILVNPYKYSTEGMIEVTASLCVDAVVTQPDAFAIGKVQQSSSGSSDSSSSI